MYQTCTTLIELPLLRIRATDHSTCTTTHDSPTHWQSFFLISLATDPSVVTVCYFMWNLNVLRSMESHSIGDTIAPAIRAASGTPGVTERTKWPGSF